MTIPPPQAVPDAEMRHCYRCGADTLGNLQHTLEECNNRVKQQAAEKQWPPSTTETK